MRVSKILALSGVGLVAADSSAQEEVNFIVSILGSVVKQAKQQVPQFLVSQSDASTTVASATLTATATLQATGTATRVAFQTETGTVLVPSTVAGPLPPSFSFAAISADTLPSAPQATEPSPAPSMTQMSVDTLPETTLTQAQPSSDPGPQTMTSQDPVPQTSDALPSQPQLPQVTETSESTAASALPAQTTNAPAPQPQPPQTTVALLPAASQTAPPVPAQTTAGPMPAPQLTQSSQGGPPVSNDPCGDILTIVNSFPQGSSSQDAVAMHNALRHYVNAYFGMSLPDAHWDDAVASQATADAQWSVANADCTNGGLAHWGEFGVAGAKNLGFRDYWYAIFQFVTYDDGGGKECQQWFDDQTVGNHFASMLQGGTRMGCGAGDCPGGQFGPVIGCDYAF
ncbi:hypothetical protein BC830DRAFT_1175580 [Chytriomyces sp. MP71]|nr:hypothetical protein BC830DRAFT_1175580 [Chytriomyces sp. MP71]